MSASSMAISLSSASAPPLIAPELSNSTTWSSQLSSLSSLRLPALFRPIGIRNKRISSPSRPRYVALAVGDKKQTFNSFDDMLQNSEKPVLVEFYATWCGPCKIMVPILQEVSATLKDKIEVVKIDSEKYPRLANEYAIEGLPTLLLFKDGQLCFRFEGALSAKDLIEQIENSLQVKQ